MPRKKRPEGTRAPNGTSSIYLGGDAKWHGRVTMGVKDDGTPDRRHVQGSEADVIRKVRELEKQRDAGTVRKPGRVPTVAEWLTHWLNDIESRTARFKTMEKHRTAVNKYLIPGVGAHRLDRIRAEHFEKLYTKIEATGVSAYTVHQVHRTARAAVNEALRRDVIAGKNVVSLAKKPQLEEVEREPFELEDVHGIIAAALTRRNGVRFVVALALGIRQGEALGIKWDRLDRKRKALKLPKQLQRQTWLHGCDNPHACGAKWHKAAPCKQPCKRHTRPCPPPCGSDCTGHARHCEKRHGGGLVEVDVKSRAGRRTLVLPDLLWDMIEAHEAVQLKERDVAGTEWHDEDWMFAQENGKPIDPRADRREWKAILTEAGVREARLHDARHTAATVLAYLEVAPRTAMVFMGWSDPNMMLRYQHVTDAMRNETARRLNGILRRPDTGQKE